MNNELIVLNSITKKYGQKQILKDINLVIHKGDSIAFLGNNGSGKSTLLRIISGLTNASSGEVTCSKRLKFNYVPELFPKMNLTSKQYIRHMGLIEGISEEILENRMHELFQAFFVENMMDTPMQNLSKGTLQKVAVIQALLSTPDVLMLDEPLSGQDVQSQRKFIAIIKELNQKGVTILMSCHEMFLVNHLCSKAYQIKEHRLEPYEINDSQEYEYDVLIFENNAKHCDINSEIKKLIQRMDYSNEGIRLVVQRNQSNFIIMQMIKEGYQLRAMRGIEE